MYSLVMSSVPSDHQPPSGWEMVRLMWLAQHEIFCSAAPELQNLGLNPKSLAVLAVTPFVPHPHDIAQSLGTPFPTISNILRELEKLGYVSRSLAPTDRRRTIVIRTPTGDHAHDEAVALVNTHSQRLFVNLTESERTQLADLIQKLSAPDLTAGH